MDLVKILPIELVYIILNYLCYPQPKELQKDIISYVDTMYQTCNIYYKKWIIEMGQIGEDINWLENDLILYANEGVPTMLGIQPKLKKIFTRFCIADKVDFYVFDMNNKLSVKTRINMLLGLFTKEEREEFITIVIAIVDR